MTMAPGSHWPLLQIKPMLAVTGQPFDSPDHIYEVKWDGYRCLAYLDDTTLLQSRNLHDLSIQFPDLADLHLQVNGKPVILDGEIIIAGEGGRASFSRLQARGRLKDIAKIRQAARQAPAIYVAFDLLCQGGAMLLDLPLHRRKEALHQVVREGENLLLSRFIASNGVSFFAACEAQGLEGVVAKELASRYLPGRRSPSWRKFKHTLHGEFVVTGWELGAGGRRLGSLILAEYQEGQLVYRGKVGTGFDASEERDLLELLTRLQSGSPPWQGSIQGVLHPHWVEPKLVAEVEYLELTTDGRLRHPVYRGLRWDKEPHECSQ